MWKHQRRMERCHTQILPPRARRNAAVIIRPGFTLVMLFMPGGVTVQIVTAKIVIDRPTISKLRCESEVNVSLRQASVFECM